MAVFGEMKVPQTGSFLSSPPEGTDGARGPAPGLAEEARNISPNALERIPITDRKTVMIRITAIISRIARNIYLPSLKKKGQRHFVRHCPFFNYLFFCTGGLLNCVSTVCPR